MINTCILHHSDAEYKHYLVKVIDMNNDTHSFPNDYIDYYMHLLDSEEWKILVYLVRHVSFHENKFLTPRLTVKTLQDALSLHKVTITKRLKSLEGFGFLTLIDRTKQGQVWSMCFSRFGIDEQSLINRREGRRTRDRDRLSGAREKRETNQLVKFEKTFKAKAIRREVSSNYDRLFIELGRRHGFRCQHCQSVDRLEVDHIHPVSLGGSNDLSNLQLLCHSCNQRKSDSVSEVHHEE